MVCFLTVLSLTVREALTRLRVSAPGSDGIIAKQLKSVASAILGLSPLFIIFQPSLIQKKFPSVWKSAIICPIYKKKGDNAYLPNYRPVSMCSSVGKLLRIIVNKQLNEHLELYHLLYSRQHSFTIGLSVTANLLMADNIIANFVEDNVPYDIIIFDLRESSTRCLMRCYLKFYRRLIFTSHHYVGSTALSQTVLSVHESKMKYHINKKSHLD